jgi:hypothetical protein
VRLLALFVELHDAGLDAVEAGVPLMRLREGLDRATLTRLKETVPNGEEERIDEAWREAQRAIERLTREAEQDRAKGAAA